MQRLKIEKQEILILDMKDLDELPGLSAGYMPIIIEDIQKECFLSESNKLQNCRYVS